MRPLLAAVLACAVAVPAAAQSPAVPAKYATLYRALDARLDAFQQRLPRLAHRRALLRAAPLSGLRCTQNADLASDARWQAGLRELDALHRIGAQAIVLEVCYPLLSPAFHDPRSLLERYANFANQVRMRDLKLLVHHATLPSQTAMAEAGRYYRGLTRQRLLAERYEEAKSIALALQPDYLTLLSDPRADGAGLALSTRDWRGYLARTSAELPRELGKLAPPLGGGLAIWGERAMLDAFAAIPGLAYLDLRFYPAAAADVDLLDRLVTWPQRVRAIDPGKRIVVSEAWLYKGDLDAPFKGADLDAMAREAFGFWSPLDVKFLRAAALGARVAGVELLGASRPQHLFAYLDFFDPATYRARARLLIDLAAQRAAASMERRELTDTGRAFGAM